MSEKFVSLFWRCTKCKQNGEVRVWQRPRTETPAQTTARHNAETKSCCIDGCRYRATEDEQ